MRKIGLAIKVLVSIAIWVVVISGCTPQTTEVPSTPTPALAETEEKREDAAESIEALQKSADPQDLQELRELAESSLEHSIRERAIFVVTDRVMRDNRAKEVVGWLRERLHEESDEVRSAAYANLDLIRRESPQEARGDLRVLVKGEIREGHKITIMFIPSSLTDASEARVGIKKILGLPGGIEPEQHRSTRFPLGAGERKVVPWTIDLRKEGKYIVLCELKLTFDLTDYETIEKEIHLDIGRESGTFAVVAPVEEPEDLE